MHVISVRDRPQRGARHGVASYTTKPADLDTLAQVFADMTEQMARPLRVLLLIENDLAKRAAIMEALAGPDRVFDAVSSAAEALLALRSRPYQGMVVELDLPDKTAWRCCSRSAAIPQLAAIPAVLYSARELDPRPIEPGQPARRRRGRRGRPVRSSELTREVTHVPAAGQACAAGARGVADDAGGRCRSAATSLRGKCVLIVDDDARNLFALTGLLEELRHGSHRRRNGRGGDRASSTSKPGIDIVLMDIMMPDMDGYETMRRIRADARFAKLPIIALTAKAMLEDRTKCLAAGASDYASKPVDTEQLLAQLCVWLAEKAAPG